MRARRRALLGACACLWLLLLPGAGSPARAQPRLRRPLDIGFILEWPSHGGSGCLHGPTGAGCRFDCQAAGPGAPEDRQGLVYQCPAGTLVLAAAEGLVLSLHDGCQIFDTTCQGGLGNWVLLEHPWGLRTLYARLSGVTVSPGDLVACAAVLGRAGQTGEAEVEGLYFEVQDLWYQRLDPFSGNCNPGLDGSLWTTQVGDDAARSCADPFGPNEGGIGAPCMQATDCLSGDAVCLEDWPGGACSAPCETTPCPVHDGYGYVHPVCMVTPEGPTCVSGCSRELFPENGCRSGYVCQWVQTDFGPQAPGCLPEPGELPDGGLPDADADIISDVMFDVQHDADSGSNLTVGGATPACACRAASNRHGSYKHFFLLAMVLLIWGLRRRFFPLSRNG
jgi:hypothetical protein